MKRGFRFASFLLGAVFLCSLIGCSQTPEEEGGVYNPSKNSDYYVEDIVKENMIFETDALFAENTEYKTVELSALPSNMTAIQYKSAPYSVKELEETLPFAVIGKPDGNMPEGGWPAVVLVHGGAGQVFPDWIRYWTNRGYVAIAPDMFGNKLDQQLNKISFFEGGPGEGQSGSINDSVDNVADSWVYHSVVNVIRCNNILRSMDCVNPNQIGITGISWGGFITCIVAGVDKRFAAFAPVYGCGYIYDDSKWSGSFGGSERERWIGLYDPSSYLPYATKPMFFVSGIDDNCFSVVNRVKSARLVKGACFYSQRSDLSHGYYYEQTEEIYEWFEHILRGKSTVIRIDDCRVADGKAYLKLKNPSFADGVTLLYTTSTAPDSHAWTFESMSLAYDGGEIAADIPEGATAICFEMTNCNIDINFKMSSQIFVL